MRQLHVFVVVFLHLCRGVLCHINVFDDSMLYDISWAGPLRSSKQQQSEKESPVLITTKDNEHYHCSLPKLREDLMDDYSPGPGPSPEELLKPLTSNTRCSYRLDSYWTYELCHGSHVRQYHDEKPIKATRSQEYTLGRAKDKEKDGEKSTKVEFEMTKENKLENKQDEQVLPPKRNLNGREVPYYEVVMDNGTPCELLNGKPRQSRVVYMCKPDSHNEIISVKEIQSCVYQLEVLTPLLCASDLYKVQEDVIHSIRCHSLKDSPREPRSYVEHIEESEADRLGFREYQYMPVQGEGPADLSKSAEHRKIPAQPDQQLTQDFLNGVYCLRGGSGWWQYEYCHSKHVLQYHKDPQGKTVIYLGQWNTDVHREWARKNPSRKSVEYVTHYYGNGEICDLTGMARTVQVRLRCMKSNHLQEVSIYLLEPTPCQYILGVDSPILCPLIKNADEEGIFPTTL